MRHSGDATIDFAEDAKTLLLSHQWRGNVRELYSQSGHNGFKASS